MSPDSQNHSGRGPSDPLDQRARMLLEGIAHLLVETDHSKQVEFDSLPSELRTELDSFCRENKFSGDLYSKKFFKEDIKRINEKFLRAQTFLEPLGLSTSELRFEKRGVVVARTRQFVYELRKGGRETSLRKLAEKLLDCKRSDGKFLVPRKSCRVFLGYGATICEVANEIFRRKDEFDLSTMTFYTPNFELACQIYLRADWPGERLPQVYLTGIHYSPAADGSPNSGPRPVLSSQKLNWYYGGLLPDSSDQTFDIALIGFHKLVNGPKFYADNPEKIRIINLAIQASRQILLVGDTSKINVGAWHEEISLGNSDWTCCLEREPDPQMVRIDQLFDDPSQYVSLNC